MAFDKKKYWENRNAGRRGQGLKPKPDHDTKPFPHFDENHSLISPKRENDPTRLISQSIISPKSFQRSWGTSIHHMSTLDRQEMMRGVRKYQ